MPQYLKFNWSKTNEICRQNSEIHPAFPCSRWPPWFPDLSRPYGACVKRGSGRHMFGLSSQISPRLAKKDSNIPSLGEQDQSNALPLTPTKTIKSPPHTLPPPPRQHNIDRCIITVNRPLSYRGKFFHRLYILPCRYRYTIHEYWSSWHWCHIQEKKHRIRQCLEQQTYWLMKKLLKNICSGPNMWREQHSFLRDKSLFPLKISLFFSVSYQFKSTS